MEKRAAGNLWERFFTSTIRFIWPSVAFWESCYKLIKKHRPAVLFYSFRISLRRAQRGRPPPQLRNSGQFLQLPLGSFFSFGKSFCAATAHASITTTPIRTSTKLFLSTFYRSQCSLHTFLRRLHCQGNRYTFFHVSFLSKCILPPNLQPNQLLLKL